MMIKRKLYRFFSGEASQAQERDILRWLDIEADNMEKFMRSRKAFDTKLLSDEGYDMLKLPSSRPFVRCIKVVTRAAAVIALAVGSGYLFSARNAGRMAELTNTVAVPSGQRVNVTLPDGTNVWLNSLSELSYPASFARGGRNVKLTGEGFFDVAHDEKNPFTIISDHYDVRVLGTRFNIVSSPGRNDFCVSVVEGSVQVTGRDNPGESLVLSGNQQAFMANGSLQKRGFHDMDPFMWRDGVLSFKSAALEDLLARFEHGYGVKIVFNHSELPNALFSGKFRTSDGISHALDVLKRDVEFCYRWDEDRNIIYIN